MGSAADITGSGQSIWAVGLDVLGDSLWTKKYYSDPNNFSRGMDITAAQDGNFLIAGNYNGAISILKINAQGDLLWSNEALAGFDASGLSVVENSDGVIIISGYETGIAGLSPIVVTLNEVGDLTNSFVPGEDELGTASGITLTDDGGYVVVGGLYDFWSSNFADTSGYIIKYDNQAEIDFYLVLDLELRAQASAIKTTSDGGYIISGSYNLGMFLQKIGGGTNATDKQSDRLPIAEIYPNPAIDRIVVELPEDLITEELSLSVFDNEGHLVQEQKIIEGTTVIDINRYPFGIYQTVISKKGKLLQNSRVVVAN